MSRVYHSGERGEIAWLMVQACEIAGCLVLEMVRRARGPGPARDARDAVLMVADCARLSIGELAEALLLSPEAVWSRQRIAIARYQDEAAWRELADDLGGAWRERAEGYPPIDVPPLEATTLLEAWAE